MTPPLDPSVQGAPYVVDGPPIEDTGVTEPDLHELGPTPAELLGVPSTDEISEARWLRWDGEPPS